MNNKLKLKQQNRLLLKEDLFNTLRKKAQAKAEEEARIKTEEEKRIKEADLAELSKQYSTYNYKGEPINSKLTLVIEKLIIDPSLTRIRYNAFSDLVKLTDVEIPSTITEIGSKAFENCISLKELYIPNTVKIIGNGFIKDCPNLKKLTLPYISTKTNFKEQILGEYSWKETKTNLDTIIFLNNPDATELANSYFSGLKAKKIVLPNNITKIDRYCFHSCENLIEINLPNTLTEIGVGAFEHCKSLETIELPNSLSASNKLDWVFDDCINLKKVNIPNGITELYRTFSGCKSLASITLPNSITNLHSTFEECTSLISITIPKSVTTLQGTFSKCTNLKNIIFENCDNIQNLNGWTFKKCTSLESLPIFKNIKDGIGPDGFKNCINLKTDIILPEGITSINSGGLDVNSKYNINIILPKSIDFLADLWAGTDKQNIYVSNVYSAKVCEDSSIDYKINPEVTITKEEIDSYKDPYYEALRKILDPANIKDLNLVVDTCDGIDGGIIDIKVKEDSENAELKALDEKIKSCWISYSSLGCYEEWEKSAEWDEEGFVGDTPDVSLIDWQDFHVKDREYELIEDIDELFKNALNNKECNADFESDLYDVFVDSYTDAQRT